jgi:hypothetical protein
MKKASMLLLLITVLTAVSFAQVSVLGGFQLGNVTGSNYDGHMDPNLWTEFYGAAGQELGPGFIGVELGLGAGLHFSDENFPYDRGDKGDVYMKGYYALPTNSGELAIGLSTWYLFNSLQFSLDYDGISVGAAALGLGAAYQLNTSGSNGGYAIFGDGDNPVQDLFTLRFSAGFESGLGIIYKFQYGIGGRDPYTEEDQTGVAKIVYLDISYQLYPLVVGLEIDDTGDKFKGFLIKPYGNFAITDNTTLGIFIKFGNINSEYPGYDEMIITPGLTIEHFF